MSLAEQGKRSGWRHQATGLMTSLRVLDPAAKATADAGAISADRRKAPQIVGPGRQLSQAIETSLVRELDRARAEIAHKMSRVTADAAASQPPSIATVVAAPRPAESASAETQAAAGAKALDERADRLGRENALLARKLVAARKASADFQAANAKAVEERADRSEREVGVLAQKLATADSALKDAQARIESLEKEKSAAAVDKENALRTEVDLLRKKLDAAAAENAQLSRAATENERTLADACTRAEYLEAALAAAEAECGRLQAEAAGRKTEQAETAALKLRIDEMSSRATAGDKLLAETREQLLAHVIEIHDAQQRAARADAVGSEALGRQRELEDALSVQQVRFEELERSQAMLAEASTHLLQRFRERDGALAAAEETIRALAERNARLETAARHADAVGEAGSPSIAPPTSLPQASLPQASLPQASLPEAEDTARQDWAELARLLGSFVERKASPRRSLPYLPQA
jgi:colicin import membrane protein